MIKGVCEVYSDATCRKKDNSPTGLSAIAFVIKDSTDYIVHRYSEFIGKTTNNVAEYVAIIKALEYIKSRLEAKDPISHISMYSDSQLVVNQVKGTFQINYKHLQDLRDRIYELLQQMKQLDMNVKITFTQVTRWENLIVVADSLANKCLDKHKE